MEENQKPELSDLVVNSKGQLCEVLELGGAVFVHLFNYLREDYWSGITFSFNPQYVSKKAQW